MDSLRNAAKKAALDISKTLPSEALIGLGSGSTVEILLEELWPILLSKSRVVEGVATSAQIEDVAARTGVRIAPFPGQVDLDIDGADQIDSSLNLIKGGGGALLKEKVVMGGAKSIAIVASEAKFSEKLCDKGVKLPIEVFPLARKSAKAKIAALGGLPEERVLPKGYPFFTENGNVILDTLFEPLADPRGTETRLKAIPGVVEVGIFTFKPITVYKLRKDGTSEKLASSN